MSDSLEQPSYTLVFTDHEQNYYLIAAEMIARGRVPAERKAEIEEALGEHDVSGYVPLLVLVGGAAGLAILGGLAADAIFDYALPDGVQSSGFVPPPMSDPNDHRLY